MRLMTSQRIIYLPGRVSRILVTALFLSSSLMITIDRWSRMVDIRTLWLQARPLQFTGGEILSRDYYFTQVLNRFVTFLLDFVSLIGDHQGLFMCRMFDESSDSSEGGTVFPKWQLCHFWVWSHELEACHSGLRAKIAICKNCKSIENPEFDQWSLDPLRKAETFISV